jgi:hypothetical protein
LTPQKLTQTELMRRAEREMGQCYWCGEQYDPKHRCKRRQLFIIEVGRDEDWECQQSEDWEAATEDEVETVHVPPSGEL